MEHLTWHDGWLCILAEDAMSGQPILMRGLYPILECTQGQAEYEYGSQGSDSLGREMRSTGYGHYVCRDGRDTQTYVLTDAGTTKPIRWEQVPIPCPKVRKGIEVRYIRGAWRKCLKSQGWVYA